MIIDHHSPSSLNTFAASQGLYILERLMGRRQSVGLPAYRGTSVETGVATGLLNPTADLRDCIAEAEREFDNLARRSADARLTKFRDSIPGMVTTAVQALRPYGVPTSTQGFITWHPEELKYPIVGYYDFKWDDHNIILDLKTTERMPSEIKVPHARQVSLYTVHSDNADGRIAYCTPKAIEVYQLDNQRQHRDALKRMAINVERFLSLSDDPEFYVGITVPDFDTFYWSSPSARRAGFEVWGF